jgi:hypothetical protein
MPKSLAKFLIASLPLLTTPSYAYSVITDIFKARELGSRMGERICALREAGFTEQEAIRKGVEPMLKELSQTKLVGTMAKNAFRDTLQETTDKCGITMK